MLRLSDEIMKCIVADKQHCVYKTLMPNPCKMIPLMMIIYTCYISFLKINSS